MTAHRFPYTVIKGFSGLKSGLPIIPITLSHEDHVVKVPGLVDSGSTVSVLLYARDSLKMFRIIGYKF